MTAREALEQAATAPPGERLRAFETTCGPDGGCHREPLSADPGRWTWCAACLTVYDDYGTLVNPIPEFEKVTSSAWCKSIVALWRGHFDSLVEPISGSPRRGSRCSPERELTGRRMFREGH